MVVYGAASGSGKTPETVSYTYTDLGQQLTVSDTAEATSADPSGTTTNTYDPAGNLIEQDTPEGSIYHSYNLATGQFSETKTAYTDVVYGYNTLGELTSTTVEKLNGAPVDQPPTLDGWRIVNREFRENLEWAVIVPGDGEMSPAVARLLEELSARGVTIHRY